MTKYILCWKYKLNDGSTHWDTEAARPAYLTLYSLLCILHSIYLALYISLYIYLYPHTVSKQSTQCDGGGNLLKQLAWFIKLFQRWCCVSLGQSGIATDSWQPRAWHSHRQLGLQSLAQPQRAGTRDLVANTYLYLNILILYVCISKKMIRLFQKPIFGFDVIGQIYVKYSNLNFVYLKCLNMHTLRF